MNTTPVPPVPSREATQEEIDYVEELFCDNVLGARDYANLEIENRTLLAEVERLTATVAQQAEEIAGLRKVTEWLPIETAPKDGTRIHIKGPGFEMESRWKVFFREPEWEQTEMFGGFNSYEGPIHPTHWKPLKQTP